jgi:phosphopentomutase
MNNFFLIILDGVGIGELSDAADYGDEGSDTLGNISKVLGGLNLPNLEKMGLGNIKPIIGINPQKKPLASFGKLREVSKGKDSITGHWELGGLYVDTDFSYFPDGFPDNLMRDFFLKTGLKGFLGNKAASGTEIIKELGEEHIETGFPIVYTSADSVFQIAAHEDIIPLKRLYEICSIVRNEILIPPILVGRVIARPFTGESGNFKRTANRKDFSIDPTDKTILNILYENNIDTIAIGKINDLFNHSGIKFNVVSKSNEVGCGKLMEYAKNVSNSFIFINLVDFDVYYGHRNDPEGFANKLKDFDNFLPSFLEIIDETDKLIITADHGNDPTTPSTDHSREYVPLLYYIKNSEAKNLGVRTTFSDVGKTIADFFDVKNNLNGTSFLNE